MSSTYFDFKQFRVYHHLSAMKVGTDSVVLGCLLTLQGNERRILDIGTGSGLLALMMAQRSTAKVDAVEVDEIAAGQAGENFLLSPWKERLICHTVPIQQFIPEHQYDLILTNPPYFESGRNFEISHKARQKARFDTDLTLLELGLTVKSLLKETGSFWLILPVEMSEKFQFIASSLHLFLTRTFFIHSRPGTPVIRKVQEYQLLYSEPEESELILYDDKGLRSEAYQKISRDFYL